VQHGAVRVIADGAEHLAFVGAGVGQQRQRLVAVAGQHDLVETLLAVVGRDHHAGPAVARRQPPHRAHRRGQPGVGDARQQLVDVVLRAAAHGVPLRPVVHLDQPVVVAEADHGADRETQHLVGRAGPDAADHRQEVAVAEAGAEAVAGQEVADRLVELGVGAAFGQRRGQPVEAQDLGQHVPETRPQQVGALGEDAVQVRAAPLQPAGRQLDRKRHLRRRGRHPQGLEQPHQARVGAVVEDQEAGVDAPRRAAKRK
jgi:hypothetical protein